MGRGRKVAKERDLPYKKVRGDESRRGGCREPNIAVAFAGGAESSSDFAILG